MAIVRSTWREKNTGQVHSPTVMTRITKAPSNQLFYHLMKAPPGLPTLVGLDVDWPGVLQSEWRVAKAILQSVWREANKIRKQIFSQSHWNKCASSQTTVKMRRSHEKPLKRKAKKRCRKSDAKNAVPTTTDLEPLGPSNGLPHRSRAVQAAATKAGLDGHFLGPWHIAE